MATENKPVHIVVDSRESRSGIIHKLSAIHGVTVEQRELSSGDYIIGDGVVVERKDATDFVNSIFEGRLFEQLAKMSIEYERFAVLIEGDIYSTRSAITPEALDGALSYISLLSGASLMFSPSLSHTPRILHRMATHVVHGLGYDIPLRAKKPKEPARLAQFIVEGLPGVGPTTAGKLLDHFGSAGAVFRASVTELVEVKGVGEKMAQAIVEALK